MNQKRPVPPSKIDKEESASERESFVEPVYANNNVNHEQKSKQKSPKRTQSPPASRVDNSKIVSPFMKSSEKSERETMKEM